MNISLAQPVEPERIGSALAGAFASSAALC